MPKKKEVLRVWTPHWKRCVKNAQDAMNVKIPQSKIVGSRYEHEFVFYPSSKICKSIWPKYKPKHLRITIEEL